MKQKIKLWWKKYWFPLLMNITFILQYGTGIWSEQKLQYYIVLTTMIILWNGLFFITIPLKESIAYNRGKLDAFKELETIMKRKQGGKKNGGTSN